jgi:hypothetical protein
VASLAWRLRSSFKNSILAAELELKSPSIPLFSNFFKGGVSSIGLEFLFGKGGRGDFLSGVCCELCGGFLDRTLA